MRVLLLLGLLLCSGVSSARTLLVSVHPLYLIAQAVTQGIEQPHLLIPAQQDGHHLQLKPTDRKRLQQADFVLWLGADYEAPLKTLLQQQKNALALSDLAAFRRLLLRQANGQPIAGSLDPHLWLDPINAIAIAHAIAAVRAAQYPQDAARYQANAQRFSQQMQSALQQLPQPQKQRGYWAYHDAYQYLEHSLHLNFEGSLSNDPELPPSPKQRQALKQRSTNTPTCLISPMALAPALQQSFMPIKTLTLDETFAHQSDFVIAWQHAAGKVLNCVAGR